MDEKAGKVDEGERPAPTTDWQAPSPLSPGPVSPISAAPPVSPTSPTVQSGRPLEPSNFVEHQQCPPPEVAIQPDEQPEPLSNLAELAADREEQNANDGVGLSAGSRRHVRRIVDEIQPDFGDERPPADMGARPPSKRSWMARHKTLLIVVAVLLVIIVVASTVGALVKRPKEAAGASAPQSR